MAVTATATATFGQNNFKVNAYFNEKSRFLEVSAVNLHGDMKFSRPNYLPSSAFNSTSKVLGGPVHSLPNVDGSDGERVPTPVLDMIENPINLKNLTSKELKQLAHEIRTELLSMSESLKSFKASLSAVELTIAIHYVFHTPADKIIWEMEIDRYPHKLLTGRRPSRTKATLVDNLSSEVDAFGVGHGCSSISSGLGMAVARDLKGRRERIVTVINNETTMAGQVYEAMSNAGYLDSNMIVILNDSRHSLHPKVEQASKASINAMSSILSKVQSSKLFRKFRELAKDLTKRIGHGMHEWAAKVDEYARGMIGPSGSTLFEELGLYYIGPINGHNIEDLICVLNEVASLDSMGPVLIHVITKEDCVQQDNKSSGISSEQQEGSVGIESSPYNSGRQSYNDHFVNALIRESERDQDIVVVHAGMGSEPSIQLLKDKLRDKFFDVGMAEQHAVTFSAGLSCGGLKPFCIIPSAFLQRAFDQVVHDVDRQKIPVRFVITSAGLVGSDGATHSGPFDITFMSCLPNMIVMAPSNEIELGRMVTTAAHIDDRPVCFRYPRGAIAKTNLNSSYTGDLIEIGKGKILVVVEGNDIALLGYGSMVQNCLRAQSLLADLGINVTIADARFCKPLDIKLVRMLCKNHKFLVTVEEGSVGGFGAHIAHFISLDGQLDAGIKWRPITLPDNYIEGAPPENQLAFAGLSGNHIAATALNLLGRTRDALQLMC